MSFFPRRLPYLNAHFESYDVKKSGLERYAIARAYLLRQVEEYLVNSSLSGNADTVYVNPPHSGGNSELTDNDEKFHMGVSAYVMKTSDLEQRRSLLARNVDSLGNWSVAKFKDGPVTTNHLPVKGLDGQALKNTNEMLRDSIIWAERGYHDKYPVAVSQARALESLLADMRSKINILKGMNSIQSGQDLEASMRALTELEDEDEKIKQQLRMLQRIRSELDHVKKPIRMRLIDKGLDVKSIPEFNIN